MVLALFIFGLLVGSFLNVVILRLETDNSIFFTHSRCPHCNHTLAALDIIPLVSFVLLTGRCRFCHKPIAWQYPLVELATGLLFAGVVLVFNKPFDILFWCFFVASFVVIVVYDYQFQLIPDAISAPLVVGSLAYIAMIHKAFGAHLLTGIATGGFIALLVILTKEQGMGWGDVPIAFLQGLLLGSPMGFFALGLSFVLGAIVGIVLIATKRAGLKTAVPFTPFLIIGLLLTLAFTRSFTFSFWWAHLF